MYRYDKRVQKEWPTQTILQATLEMHYDPAGYV
jgi:hypothetical protein